MKTALYSFTVSAMNDDIPSLVLWCVNVVVNAENGIVATSAPDRAASLICLEFLNEAAKILVLYL